MVKGKAAVAAATAAAKVVVGGVGALPEAREVTVED